MKQITAEEAKELIEGDRVFITGGCSFRGRI